MLCLGTGRNMRTTLIEGNVMQIRWSIFREGREGAGGGGEKGRKVKHHIDTGPIQTGTH